MLHMKLGFLVAAVLAVAPFAAVQADEHGAEAKELKVKGVNISLLETYGSEADKENPSPDHGKHNALKVAEATDAEGNAVEGMEGVVLYYLPNAAGDALLAGDAHKGASVTVQGRVLAEARLIAVDSFESEGGGDAFGFDDWDDLSPGSMSGQPVF